MKTKSKAYLEAEAYRDAVNPELAKISAKDLSCVVYYGEPNGYPMAKGYRGRAQKPAFVYRFNDEAKRATHISNFIEKCMERKVSYKADPRALEVGDVLNSTWGYEQTNQDYYLVTKLIGKSMVEIVEIGQIRSYDAQDRGDCCPDVSCIVGKPMKKIANGTRVKVRSFCSAYKMEPKAIIDGVKVFDKTYWTAYH